jgi:lipoate-protein ligase A
MSVTEFMKYIEDRVAAQTGAETVEFSHDDKINIRKLADLKYSTWEWNFGKSKEYAAEKKKRYDFGSVGICFTVDGGIICKIKIAGDFFGVEDIDRIEETLTGLRFERDAIEAALDGTLVSRCIAGMDKEAFISLLFS